MLRGADTKRIDEFAADGFQMMNYAPEAQCSPTRAALDDGPLFDSFGNTKATAPGMAGGLVAWEKTMETFLRCRICHVVHG